MCAYLPELVALPLLPLLLIQGRRTRRRTPRLPPAQGRNAGTVGCEHDGAALSLLAVGESPVAGVGVLQQEEGITAQLAHALSARLQRPVGWQAYGKNGATAQDALGWIGTAVPCRAVDVALIAFGVNDTTAFRAPRRWRADLHEILAVLAARCRPRLIIVSGVPPIARFPALPQPLRAVMGLKAQALDRVARDVVQQAPRTLYVRLAVDGSNPALLAHDGYHPSALGCKIWAQLLADAAVPALRRGIGAAGRD